ncbi:hypothetical protein [Hymenobacter metallicola]|uniref:Uncharacterized protein n=1 Tax=Hymenobacter metallicola TaxID=2563114 RepID=A0A4Z0QM06_9BACT|nr:hypothetical protein [Hymenobacter metallicola]TGE29772.1 hypothetical protein E5K02_10020 [Hymenobacter metallicola]
MADNKEQAFCAIVTARLTEDGWAIYQEVETPVGRADIVAVRDGIRWAVEVKTSMNLAVMDQARANAAYFHYSSVAVAAPKGGPVTRSWRFAEECGQVFGFGVISLHPKSHETQMMRTRSRGRLNRRPLPVKLHEEQKSEVQAGSNRGGQWTTFKSTLRNLEIAVRHSPGIRLRDAIKRISHHYSNEPSATGSISRYIRTGVIKTLRLENGLLYEAKP